jgi:DNA-binding response OmpR family regulator
MRILLIEDDEGIVAFLKRGLQAEGHIVHVAGNGRDGARKGLEPHDVIILDLVLPDISGNEVCRSLRNHDIATPILLLTAKDEIDDKLQGFSAGADDYLTKPFAFEELLARLKALLRRTAGQEQERELRVGDLVLNRDSRDVRRGKRAIELTAKEFRLLEYLMSRPSRTVDRQTLLEEVWSYQADTVTNVVDVYIGYLRKKIDEGHNKKLIHTVREVGYMIRE